MRKVRSAKAVKRRRKTRPRRRAASADAVETALAMLAHEIRTPLNGILAMSELIAAADLPERERQWASQVKGASEHLAALATLVVDGVRASKRGLVLREEPFRLRALAEAVGATLAARAEAKGLAADIAIADDLPDLVAGDRVRLRAALENLADNAVKFTERGRVAMAVSVARAPRRRHKLTVTLTDSGIGLTRQEIARLFRPFSQANAAVARRYGGSGLGLAFVRRLAKAMGGDLTVRSRPGHGSTFGFTVTLAQATAAAAAGGGSAAAKTDAATKSLRVLCAEDNPYARVVLNTILVELGHRVDFAGTGESAVAAVNRGGYELVLMDVTLPGMDGLSATRAIRALRGAAAHVPVIGISGRTAIADEEAARAAGMNAFLAKPVSPAALAQAVAKFLRQP
ncbi:MAG: two-component system, sensor histidine kinase [Hyphomicrobiales bacterium]|nr:two-component system, sensor histidine kinase [Hyphomicrobiales bacterium]